ncbi:MAG: type II restriction endonuclease [Phycisphaerales bacterium JB050]
MRLKEHFTGVAAKRLKPVEADPTTSNQHEFNGIESFKKILGEDRVTFHTIFLHLDDDDPPTQSDGSSTWYDARENHPSRSEYRLYFPSNDVTQNYAANDLVIVGLRPNNTLLIISTPAGSTVGSQLLWLFGLDDPEKSSIARTSEQFDRDVNFVSRWVLESIGIEDAPDSSDKIIDQLKTQFGSTLPSTRVFSEFARSQSKSIDPITDPDCAIMEWLETEERYFRAFERILVEQRLRDGFVRADGSVDVDDFVSFSLSVQNRRKSRAGYALENHLEFIFKQCKLRFDRGARTEGRSKPDFLFPGRNEYQSSDFKDHQLTVLGAKATCKDRWRQILGEADRVKIKHLITLEPGISENQTTEMESRLVQLVLPIAIHPTFSRKQQDWLWSVRNFIDYVKQQQP